MKPVFMEEYNMLKGFGMDDGYDDKLFIDRNILFGFSQTGDKIKIARITNISQENISIKSYGNDIRKSELINHIQYYEDVRSVSISEKVNEAHIVLDDFLKNNKELKKIIIMNSTGKDSMVADMVISKYEFKNNIDIKRLFVNTSLDCHQTYKMVKDMNYEILNPKIGFYDWIKTDIIPTRTVRKCCDIFKEGNVAENYDPNEKICFVSGIRNDESENRKDYPFVMVNSKWDNVRKSNWILLNIIKNFTEDDVWYCICKEIIKVNPLYKLGYSRVGCVVACPYQKTYVNFLDSIFLKTYYKKWNDIKKDRFIKDKMWVSLNCTIDEFLWDGWKKGMKYRDEPNDDVIREFCEYTGHSSDTALKYFQNHCKNGCLNRKGKPQQLSATNVGLNLKLISRHLKNGDMMCEKCLSEALGIKRKDLRNMAKDFKKQNCNLF